MSAEPFSSIRRAGVRYVATGYKGMSAGDVRCLAARS